MSTLWHYTCAQGLAGIQASGGVLLPIARQSRYSLDVALTMPPHARSLLALVWATDLAQPDAAALGLTSHTLSCDRTAHRLQVTRGALTWWPAYRHRLPPLLVQELETAEGAQPQHWWVTRGRVRGAELAEPVTPGVTP